MDYYKDTPRSRPTSYRELRSCHDSDDETSIQLLSASHGLSDVGGCEAGEVEEACKDNKSECSADTIGTLLLDVNDENDLNKHPDYCEGKQKHSFSTRLKGYAKHMRASMGSIKDKGMSTLPFTRKLDTLSNIHETNAIEKDMKDLFRKKRKLELFYMLFCAATMIVGLLAMMLYDLIKNAMFGVWGICIALDVVIVAGALIYGHMELNRIEAKYPQRNVKEEWAAILKHELGHS